MRTDRILPQDWKRLLAANSDATSFGTRIITITEPTGVGVIENRSAETLELAFFGAGTAAQTFDALVIGWNELRNGTKNVWVPVPIVHLTCTLGSAVGLAAADIIDTDLLAHTIAVAANGGIGVIASQTGGNRMAKAEVGIEGYRKVEVIFDMTGATNGNCIYRMF